MLPPVMATASNANRDWVRGSAGFLFVLLTVVGVSVAGDHPSSIGLIDEIKSRFLAVPGPFATQAGSYVQALATLPLIALVALAIAFGSLSTAALARWYGWLMGVVGLVLLSGGADLARSGFFSVQGDHWFYLLLTFIVWMLLTSGMLLRRPTAMT